MTNWNGTWIRRSVDEPIEMIHEANKRSKNRTHITRVYFKQESGGQSFPANMMKYRTWTYIKRETKKTNIYFCSNTLLSLKKAFKKNQPRIHKCFKQHHIRKLSIFISLFFNSAANYILSNRSDWCYVQKNWWTFQWSIKLWKYIFLKIVFDNYTIQFWSLI